MPKVSVIVFVVGAAPFLSECLDSIAKQTLPDIEIVLVCGALTDQASMVCAEFKEMHNNVKIVHTDSDKLSNAYDTGIAIASGRYIMFIKSEDLIQPKACELMYVDAIKNDSDLVKCGLIHISRYEKKAQILNWEEWILSTIKPEDVPFQLSKYKHLLTYHGAVWMTLFRTDFIKTMKFAEGCGSEYQEYAFMIKSLIKAQRISVVRENLYLWCIDDLNDADYPIVKKGEDLFRILEPFEAAKQWMLSRGCFEDFIPEFYKQVMIVTKGFYEIIPNELKPKFYKLLQQFYSDINMFVFPQVTQMFSSPQVQFLIDILKDS